MFKAIKLWFTDRNYYNQRKRYMKIQKAYRKELVKQAKDFCPWSGYYMHEMIITMLEFYHKTFSAGDCCWCEEQAVKQRAAQVEKALDYAKQLNYIDDMQLDELLHIAQKDKTGFIKYVAKMEKKLGTPIEEKMLGYVAYEYLEDKYTKAMYDTIGKHIWNWRD